MHEVSNMSPSVDHDSAADVRELSAPEGRSASRTPSAAGRVPRTLHVLHVVHGLTTGGMENGVINLCHRLPGDAFRSSIAVFSAGGSMESRVDQQRVPVVRLSRRFGNDPGTVAHLARYCRENHVDILHSHCWSTLLESWLASRLLRGVKTIHGEHGLVEDKLRRRLAQRFIWPRMNRILSVSAELADRLSAIVGFPRERIEVIPNGVDTERFFPRVQDTDSIRSQWNLPARVFLLGMIGRFVDFKDHAGVIRALNRLGERGGDVHLALAGSGPLLEETRKLAESLGVASRVHFLGEVEQIPELLCSLDGLISNSSHREGMSNVVLEAMACGVPVLATRVAASPELLGDGAYGTLISPRSPDELAEAILRLKADPARGASLRDRALERIRSHYSLAAMCAGYAQLYRSVSGAVR